MQSLAAEISSQPDSGSLKRLNRVNVIGRVLANSLEAIDKPLPQEITRSIARLLTNVNTVLGDESIDPTSARAKEIIRKVQTVMRDAVAQVASGEMDVSDFENQTQLGQLFAGVEQGADEVDTDGDGLVDALDGDDDNDGVSDGDDVFPRDPNETDDTDNDGVGNNADDDDDNDGILDFDDAFPEDSSESIDTDGDGIGNNADTDDDNDAVEDSVDTFPLDPSESVDTDGDGVGNNADTDDDNDGVSDVTDAAPENGDVQADSDGDGIDDALDGDDDNDSVPDEFDADADGDGFIDELKGLLDGDLSSLTLVVSGPAAGDAALDRYKRGDAPVIVLSRGGSYVGHGAWQEERGAWRHVPQRISMPTGS